MRMRYACYNCTAVWEEEPKEGEKPVCPACGSQRLAIREAGNGKKAPSEEDKPAKPSKQSTEEPTEKAQEEETVAKRGRPKGSTNKPKEDSAPKKRGRPKGSTVSKKKAPAKKVKAELVAPEGPTPKYIILHFEEMTFSLADHVEHINEIPHGENDRVFEVKKELAKRVQVMFE